MGIAKAHPELKIVHIPPVRISRRQKGIKLGIFHGVTSKLDLNINPFLNKKDRLGKSLYKTYINLLDTSFHELRHFKQKVFDYQANGINSIYQSVLEKASKQLGFMTFGSREYMEAQQQLLSRVNTKLYQNAAEAMGPISREDRELVKRIKTGGGYDSVNSLRPTKEYFDSPEEIDANEFAAKKIQEIRSSIKSAGNPIQAVFGMFSKK